MRPDGRAETWRELWQTARWPLLRLLAGLLLIVAVCVAGFIAAVWLP